MIATGNELRYVGRKLLRLNPAGRNVTVFPDDVFLVSYPRSGNTWARFLVGNLIHPDEPMSFANVEGRIPDIYLHPDHKLRALLRPRVLKSHEYFDPRYGRVIYIVRDPREVAVSLYYYCIKKADIPEGYPMAQFITEFMAAKYFEFCGTWEEHVTSWRATRHGRNEFLLLHYEEMLADPAGELAKVAGFLHIAVTRQVLERAIDLSCAMRMRQMETTQFKDWTLIRKTRQDIPFVRSASAHSWTSHLPPACVHAIEERWGSGMRNLGYATPDIDMRRPLRARVRSISG